MVHVARKQKCGVNSDSLRLIQGSTRWPFLNL